MAITMYHETVPNAAFHLQRLLRWFDFDVLILPTHRIANMQL